MGRILARSVGSCLGSFLQLQDVFIRSMMKSYKFNKLLSPGPYHEFVLSDSRCQELVGSGVQLSLNNEFGVTLHFFTLRQKSAEKSWD